MKKRRLIAILIAFILTIAATAMWSAATIEREGDPDANVLEDSGAETGTVEAPKKGGNKVVRVLAAPFKAFGKLFRHKDRIERMSEKDSNNFATVGVSRTEDGRYPEPDKTSISVTAKEHLAAGREFLLAGRLNEAITELSTAASIDPKLSEAHNLLGVAYDKKGFADRAKDSYQSAIKAQPEDPEILNNLGFSLYQNGNYRAAVDRLKRAAKLAPNDARILNNLGLALCRLGKFDDAYKHFARATGAYTGNLNTARMLERFGRDDDAIKYYEAARRIEPNSTLAVKRLADLYKRTGRTDPLQVADNGTAAVAAANTSSVGK
jgi:Tfp pilus assembly protein PilF